MAVTAAEFTTTAKADQQIADLRTKPAPAPADLGIVLTLHLAGRSYPIPVKYSADNRAWRQRFESYAGPLRGIIELVKTAKKGVDVKQAFKDMEISDIAAAAADSLPAIMGSVDDLIDLVFVYDPSLDADREFILERETDESMIAAFLQILGVVYPVKKLAPAIG